MAVTLGERMRTPRHANGKALREVAAVAGVTIGHISEIERGNVMPSVAVLEKLGDAYGLTLADLMQGVRVNGPMPLDFQI